MSRYSTKSVSINAVMAKVYIFMAIGLIISGLVAVSFAFIPDLYSKLYIDMADGTRDITPMGLIMIFSPIAIVIIMQIAKDKASVGILAFLCVVFCAVMGTMLSSLFLVYELSSLGGCFFITAGAFVAMSIYGLTTKKDLSSWGTFLLMALFGLIISMIVNLFLGSSMMDFLISLVAVVIFSALIGYDNQKIRDMLQDVSGEEATKTALMGAVSLYLDFVNLLIHIVKLLGVKK